MGLVVWAAALLLVRCAAAQESEDSGSADVQDTFLGASAAALLAVNAAEKNLDDCIAREGGSGDGDGGRRLRESASAARSGRRQRNHAKRRAVSTMTPKQLVRRTEVCDLSCAPVPAGDSKDACLTACEFALGGGDPPPKECASTDTKCICNKACDELPEETPASAVTACENACKEVGEDVGRLDDDGFGDDGDSVTTDDDLFNDDGYDFYGTTSTTTTTKVQVVPADLEDAGATTTTTSTTTTTTLPKDSCSIYRDALAAAEAAYALETAEAGKTAFAAFFSRNMIIIVSAAGAAVVLIAAILIACCCCSCCRCCCCRGERSGGDGGRSNGNRSHDVIDAYAPTVPYTNPAFNGKAPVGGANPARRARPAARADPGRRASFEADC